MNPSGELELVNAHHHLQDYERDRYPSLAPGKMGGALSPELSPLRRNYTVRDLKVDLAGVTLIKFVHVQNQREPRDPVGETVRLQSIADAEGFPHAIVAFADLVMAPERIDRVRDGREYRTRDLDGKASTRDVEGVRRRLN